MRLSEFSYKNILSYGNKIQTFKFDDQPGLILVEGENGAGKCLVKDTLIDVEISDPILRDKFIKFLKESRKSLD